MDALTEPLTAGELRVALDRVYGQIRTNDLKFLRALERVEESGVWADEGTADFESWVAKRYRMTYEVAATHVRRMREFRSIRGASEALKGAALPIEVAEARETATRVARPGRRQSRQANPEIRIAVENFAMAAAAKHYEEAGWTVQDVSRHECYDLRCTKEERSIHVEVKGTQSRGDAVLLTPNEVAHAENYSDCVLFIVANVDVDSTGERPIVSGGRVIVFDPWEIGAGVLKPIGFEFWPEKTNGA